MIDELVLACAYFHMVSEWHPPSSAYGANAFNVKCYKQNQKTCHLKVKIEKTSGK